MNKIKNNAQTVIEFPHNLPKEKNTTPVLSHKNLQKDWVIIDASNVVLGRLASFIATRIRGKHKASYTPNIDSGDNIIIINSDKVVITGNKENDKLYYYHTGYPGGIKKRSAGMIRSKDSTELVYLAVKRMLASGPLSYKQIKKLHVYGSDHHPHVSQNPVKIDFAGMSRKNYKN